MNTLTVLDAFCCAGGATRGYQLAGFHVTGVDIAPQPRYCGDAFHQGDAVAFIREHGHRFDFIHASPPCQAYTLCQRIQGNIHPDLVDATREALQATGRPWVIENVPGAPLRNPAVLCGPMFGLRTYRERLFECGGGFTFTPPLHPAHRWPVTKMGRPPLPGHFLHIVGNFSGAELAHQIMGTPWMTRDEMREAIPPAYTRFIGHAARTLLTEMVAV
jgi:DNA (cytosine-5)-methyltransferase 1